MDPSIDIPPLDIIALLRAHRIIPKKGLGQNFLVDPTALENIIAAAEITQASTVLEIGAGLGSLTRYLAYKARRVIAVELDSALIPILHQVLSPWDNVTIIQADILKIDPSQLIPGDCYLVVANIPYFITSALIRHLLEASPKPCRLVLTVQREVAARICASPGNLSLLALSIQVYGQPWVIDHLPSECFYPSPKVDSTVIRVDILHQPVIPQEQLAVFFSLAKAGFSQKRKMLKNALPGKLGMPRQYLADLLHSVGIDPQRRAETLSLQEWQTFTDAYYRNSSPIYKD